MNRSLFDIEQSMYNLLNYGVDDETGEVVQSEEEFNKLYDSIKLDINTKLDNTNCLCKMLDGEIDVIDKELERLQKEKKRRENTKEFLQKRVDGFIRRQFTDDDGNLNSDKLLKFKLDLPHSKISYRKSESVNITDEKNIPKEYMRTKIETTVDKNKVKEAIKKGIKVDGCEIVNNYKLQVK